MSDLENEPPSPFDHAFSDTLLHGAGQTIPAPLATERAALLERLAARAQRQAIEIAKDPDGVIPAGFTYLGQLVAHDMTRPISLTDTGARRPLETSVLRQFPLYLATLYGDGPIGSPMLYEIEPGSSVVNRSGRLRLGSSQTQDGRCDIARLGLPVTAETMPTSDTDAMRKLGSKKKRVSLTDAVLADPRNDDNLLVSQMLTVFARLHNRLYDVFLGASYERTIAFERARRATTAIYRWILREDFFPRLVGRQRFGQILNDGAFLEFGPAFNHGAFRCCHAMVRSKYRRSKFRHEDSISAFLHRTSHMRAGSLPVNEKWLIDWTLFFEHPDGTPPLIMSRKINPSLAGLLDAHAKGPLSALRRKTEVSLLWRDYLRADALTPVRIDDLHTVLPGIKLPPHAWLSRSGDARAAIKTWLSESNEGAAQIPALSQGDMDQIAEQPPLPFLVGLEAIYEAYGQSLGPFGGTLVGAMVAPLLSRIDDTALDDAKALADLDIRAGEPGGPMSQLIHWLHHS